MVPFFFWMVFACIISQDFPDAQILYFPSWPLVVYSYNKTSFQERYTIDAFVSICLLFILFVEIMENIKPDWKLIVRIFFAFSRSWFLICWRRKLPVGKVPYLCESDHGSLAVKKCDVCMLWQDVFLKSFCSLTLYKSEALEAFSTKIAE